MPIKILDSGATFSDDKAHRYSLWRTWDYDKPRILFIGLNPSRADHIKNDPTITRCIGFAHRWGYGSLYFGNLFSFRTPYVHRKEMKPDIEEQWLPLIENLDNACDQYTDGNLVKTMLLSEKIVCCWGNWKFAEERERAVQHWLLFIEKPAYCFGTNNNGSPKHPLYLKADTALQQYSRVIL